jgi:hypothetical protein
MRLKKQITGKGAEVETLKKSVSEAEMTALEK